MHRIYHSSWVSQMSLVKHLQVCMSVHNYRNYRFTVQAVYISWIGKNDADLILFENTSDVAS